MPRDGLPDDGEVRLGAVSLPAGRRILGRYGDSNEPVAWATIQPVPDVGTVWQALAGMRQETGLVPILLAGLDGGTKRPWDDGEFDDPEDIGELDRLGAAQVLETSWADSLEELDELDGEVEEDPEAIAEREPFTRQFPGLAPAVTPCSARHSCSKPSAR